MTKAAKANQAAKAGKAKAAGGKRASAMTKLVRGLIQKVKKVGARVPVGKTKSKPAPAKPAAVASKARAKPTGKPVAKPAARSGRAGAAKPVAKVRAKSKTKAQAQAAVRPPKAKPEARKFKQAKSKKPATAERAAPPKVRPAATAVAAATRPVSTAVVRAGGSKQAAQSASAAPPPSAAGSRPAAVAVAVAIPKSKQTQKMPPKKPGAPIKVVGTEVVRPVLPEGYKPSSKEPYMSPYHIEYFRQKLLKWRAELVEESKQTIDNLRDEVRDVGDEAERATRETENSLELRTRDRYRKLIAKIDKALKRIDDGEYGYCEETGEEIGLERLEARPIATLCLDAQERWEHRQRQLGE